VIVYGGVQEVVAAERVTVGVEHAAALVGLLVPPSGAVPELAPAAAFGNLAELFHVDVDHVAGCVVLVAANGLPGRPVQPPQLRQTVAGQDAMHRRGVQSEQVADTGRSPPAKHPDFDDATLCPGGGPARTAVRPRRTLDHARFPELAVAVRPPHGRGVRHLEPFGRPTQRPPVLHHTAGQTQPTQLGQRGVTVNHEDLREFECFAWQLALHPEVFALSARHAGQPVTNVRGQYT
jgi:hypothetical protein